MKYLDLKSFGHNPSIWHGIGETLSSLQIKEHDFNRFLWFFQIPPGINSFGITVSNLAAVVTHIEQISSANKYPDKELFWLLKHSRKICQAIITNKHTLEESFPDIFHYQESDLPPFRGFYESHTLGVALWCSPKDATLNQRYRILQAMVSYAIHLLNSRQSHYFTKNPSTLVESCRVVRKLALAKNSTLLAALPNAADTMESYYKSLKHLSRNSLLHPVIHLLDFALALKTVVARKRQLKKESLRINPFNKKRQLLHETSENPAIPDEILTVLTVNSGTKKENLARRRMLCSPDEFAMASEYMTYEEVASKDETLSFSQQYCRVKGASIAIARDNQRLPFAWHQLTVHEIVTFLNELSTLSAKTEPVECIPSTAFGAFLAIIFWTSSDIAKASAIKLVSQPHNCRDALGIYRDREKLYWVIRIKEPQLKHVRKAILDAQAITPVTYYTMDMPPAASAIIMPQLRGIPDSFKNQRIFPCDYVNIPIENIIDRFLASLNKQMNLRLNYSRISTAMHYHLARMPGSDITAAMSITGRDDHLGRVPLHYTATSTIRLQELYHLACQDLCPDHSHCITVKPTTSYVGSRYVPISNTVRNLVNDLKSRLIDGRSEYETLGNPRQLHNELTVYTILMLGFATGYRAVKDPLLQDAEIDNETGFAVISDKDSDDFYNSRLVWLPTRCLEQLRKYRQHLVNLQDWLFEQNQDLFFKSRRHAVVGRHGVRCFPALFLFEPGGNEWSARPKTLEELLDRLEYKLPLNANRHYLRSSLMEAKCPVEVVNALMGHWERGLEPWGRWSGMSPHTYRDSLQKYLVPLLEGAGWTVESGLIAGVGP